MCTGQISGAAFMYNIVDISTVETVLQHVVQVYESNKEVSWSSTILFIPYEPYVFGQTGLSKDCRSRSDATEQTQHLIRVYTVYHSSSRFCCTCFSMGDMGVQVSICPSFRLSVYIRVS